ncbi:shieldin complex subunit 2 isoform X3 [Rhinatrema bivittatum]|uniref:shieldin complex subunit 2 isoform X3 n=1 Tax=Rhinatrema bivittatum TaxID=194408 RepID=UPI00112663E1|nr:shieldin complex subunit 2 isoform X3 [Rhinatrema bivittatum]
MSKQLQIHIFLGAPIIATQQETSKEQRPSVANVETWRESHIVCDKQFFSVGVDKCKADNDSKQENLELVTTGVSELFSTAHESEAACTEVHKTTTKSQNITAVFGHKISKDVSVYEDSWYGETMLQTSFGSQLLNLGRCSSLNHKELGVTALQDLLAYVSLKHGYLWDLPERQPQSLEHVQHVHLSRLQPDTLVHSVLQVLSIIVLTESVYLYKGQKQRKIILTVEQVKGQPYTLVLWGTATAWYPQIQRRKGHLWEFRNILSQRNSLTGEIELHTTPWSSCECLFDDDKRAIDFKAQYQTNKASAMEQVIGIAALLEEKFSGEIQVQAHIAELQFTMPALQSRRLILDADMSLELILNSLPAITYSGCGACGSELKLDENKIYLQCFNCLPVNQVKTYYRPALMTAVDGEHMIHVHVPSEILQKIFLNIPPDWLNRTIVSSSDVTYGMIVADLCHSLLTSSEDSYRLKIQSSFELDENSVPMQQDFFLLDFHQDLLYSEISPEEQAIWKGSGTQKKIVKEV